MAQRLKKISEHVWVYTFDSPKDRPNLGYICGGKMSIAVDAGHSSSHVADFYEALDREGLPRPELTVITHWHWDHTFGMHAVDGKTIARPETNRELKRIRAAMADDPNWAGNFLTSDPSIRKEYAGGVPLAVVCADEEIDSDRTIDLGGVTAELMYTESPHTDDSLLVYIPQDNVLFIGDAQLGEFPSWKMDYDKLAHLAQKIRRTNAKLIVDGHWNTYGKEEFLIELGV